MELILSGHRSFDELRARTPERQERVATYEQALRASLQLREVRTRLGLSQRQVAERMAVSQEFVSKLERGSDPRLSSIRRYANAIGGDVRITVVLPDQETVDISLETYEHPVRQAPERRSTGSRVGTGARV